MRHIPRQTVVLSTKVLNSGKAAAFVFVLVLTGPHSTSGTRSLFTYHHKGFACAI